jgi:hypothetical protein
MLDSATRLLALAFILAATVLAGHWATMLTAPRPVAVLPTTSISLSASSTQAISHLFSSGTTTQPQVLSGYRLTGIYAGTKGGGFATIYTPNGEVSAFAGDDVAPGIVLKQIDKDRVTLTSGGVERELKLPEGNAPVASPSAASPPNSIQFIRPRLPMRGMRTPEAADR